MIKPKNENEMFEWLAKFIGREFLSRNDDLNVFGPELFFRSADGFLAVWNALEILGYRVEVDYPDHETWMEHIRFSLISVETGERVQCDEECWPVLKKREALYNATWEVINQVPKKKGKPCSSL